MMTVSFGIEFEFDYVDQNNQRVVFHSVEPIYLAPNWNYQLDPTASSELRSPVFTSIEQFIDECNNEFSTMVQRRPQLIPYMCNSQGRSLGQHIGIPSIPRNFPLFIKIFYSKNFHLIFYSIMEKRLEEMECFTSNMVCLVCFLRERGKLAVCKNCQIMQLIAKIKVEVGNLEKFKQLVYEGKLLKYLWNGYGGLRGLCLCLCSWMLAGLATALWL